jgi:hypothetical protein
MPLGDSPREVEGWKWSLLIGPLNGSDDPV